MTLEPGGVILVLLAVVAVWPWTVRTARSRRAGAEGGAPTGHRGARGRARRRPGRSGRRERAREPVVDEAVVLDMVRAALRSGSDVVTAIASVGAALPAEQGEPCVQAARALRLGSSWEAAWQQPGELARALAPAWSDGVDPEPLLVHAATAMRNGRQARAREAAARLGVRLVLPLGLCLLPAFVLLGLVPLLISAGIDVWSP